MAADDGRKSQLLSLGTIVLVMAVCYGLDTITISWRRHVQNTFDWQPLYLFRVGLLLLFAALAILLSWVLLVRFKPAWPSLIVGLVVGLGSVAFMVSLIAPNPALLLALNLPLLTGPRTVMFELATASLTIQAGAFLSVISLVNLIRKVGVKRRA